MHAFKQHIPATQFKWSWHFRLLLSSEILAWILKK